LGIRLAGSTETSASRDLSGIEAIVAGFRQAEDLISACYHDVRKRPGDPADFHPVGYAAFQRLLDDGLQWGITFSYDVQDAP
jgi:hypothetical protein